MLTAFVSSAWTELVNHNLSNNPRLLVLLLFNAPVALVVLNIIFQFIPWKDNQRPPVVFHWLPFIGSAVPFGRNPVQFFSKCREKYGDIFTVIMLGRKITVILGARGNKFVLGAKSAVFNAEDAYRAFATPVFGKDVGYDVPNDVFMEQKKFLQLGLSTSNFRAHVGMIMDEVHLYMQTNPTLNALRNDNGTQWRTLDINDVMSELVILTATRTLHGAEIRESLDGSTAGYYSDLDGGLGPLNFLFPHLPLPSYWKRDHAQRQLSKFYINIIQKRKAGATDFSDNDLITTLLDQRYRNGSPLKEHVIAHLLIAILMAGRHTTSSTASWIVIHLAANPGVAEALYAEQVQYFRDDQNGEWRAIGYDEILQLPLMNAVIRETLRLHPPIHSIMRWVRQDASVPPTISTPSLPVFAKDITDVTYVVPEGHYVLASPAVSQKDAQVWPEAGLWDPYRWMDPKSVAAEAGRLYESETTEDTKYERIGLGSDSPYQPFGAGGHRCIGEKFANMQLATIIGTLIRQVQFHVDSIPEHNYYTTITLPMSGLIQCRRRVECA